MTPDQLNIIFIAAASVGQKPPPGLPPEQQAIELAKNPEVAALLPSDVQAAIPTGGKPGMASPLPQQGGTQTPTSSAELLYGGRTVPPKAPVAPPPIPVVPADPSAGGFGLMGPAGRASAAPPASGQGFGLMGPAGSSPAIGAPPAAPSAAPPMDTGPAPAPPSQSAQIRARAAEAFGQGQFAEALALEKYADTLEKGMTEEDELRLQILRRQAAGGGGAGARIDPYERQKFELMESQATGMYNGQPTYAAQQAELDRQAQAKAREDRINEMAARLIQDFDKQYLAGGANFAAPGEAGTPGLTVDQLMSARRGAALMARPGGMAGALAGLGG